MAEKLNELSKGYNTILTFLTSIAVMDGSLAERVGSSRDILKDAELSAVDFVSADVSRIRSIALAVRFDDIRALLFSKYDDHYFDAVLMMSDLLTDCVDPTQSSWLRWEGRSEYVPPSGN